jgi:hypothetical protein
MRNESDGEGEGGKEGGSEEDKGRTDCMNFLHVARTSLARVAENIMTCLWAGVARKMDCTSLRMSKQV